MLSVDDINKLEAKIEELKAENERLKEEILKFRWDNPYFDLYNNVVNQRNMWEQKSEQYKSCLQEIKKYCEKCKDCIEVGDEVIIYTIIQKINKIEDIVEDKK